MKRLATSHQSQEIDRQVQNLGIASGEVLMEAAALSCLNTISQTYVAELQDQARKIVIVCGPGNNGGDGLALGRHFVSAGRSEVLVVCLTESGSSLFELQRERARRAGVKMSLWSNVDSTQLDPGLIIDAVFGVGLTRPVEGVFAEAVSWMNSQTAPVVSLDVPSGLDADRGIILGCAPRADRTITFGLAKPGLFISEGPAVAGQIEVHSIGFPPEVVQKIASTHFLFDGLDANSQLPQVKATANKAQLGRVGIFAGRDGMWGAALLCAHSAARSGAGYVTLLSHEDLREFTVQMPEVITGRINDESAWSKRFSAVAVGPGLGVNDKTKNILFRLKRDGYERVVVDADAISVCVQENLFPLPASWVLTPHSGELARVLGESAETVERDRFQALTKAHQKTGCRVILKGYRTVVYNGSQFRIINAGNVALAKAGSGDVLTGILAGLLAQKIELDEALCLGVFIHGRLADIWVESGHSNRSLQPSDLIGYLPKIFRHVEDGFIP